MKSARQPALAEMRAGVTALASLARGMITRLSIRSRGEANAAVSTFVSGFAEHCQSINKSQRHRNALIFLGIASITSSLT